MTQNGTNKVTKSVSKQPSMGRHLSPYVGVRILLWGGAIFSSLMPFVSYETEGLSKLSFLSGDPYVQHYGNLLLLFVLVLAFSMFDIAQLIFYTLRADSWIAVFATIIGVGLFVLFVIFSNALTGFLTNSPNKLHWIFMPAAIVVCTAATGFVAILLNDYTNRAEIARNFGSSGGADK
jgi:hypothetical protein